LIFEVLPEEEKQYQLVSVIAASCLHSLGFGVLPAEEN
jgi:hypothetical protein